MRRTQIRLDEKTFQALRRRARERACSVSALARELLRTAVGGLTPLRRKKRQSLKDFKFVGAGKSHQGRLSPVSERHDEALAEVLWMDLKHR
jgi:plasmid stability protein